MSLTHDQKQAHDRYENAHHVVKQAVDDAYKAARESLKKSLMSVANDDRAEAFVAAIMVYVEDSAE